MTRRTGSPEGGSGAGSHYESLVGASLLTDLLLGDTPEGLVAGPIDVVGFQKGADTRFDDFFVKSRDGYVVVYDAKLTLDLGERAFQEIVLKAVDEWSSWQEDLTARRRHYCVVTTSFSPELAKLISAARSYHGPTDGFVARFGSRRKYVRWWKSLCTAISHTGAVDVDGTALRVLRNLVVWHLDASPDRNEELRIRNRLRQAGHHDPVATLDSLKALANNFARDGSEVTRDELVRHLSEHRRRPYERPAPDPGGAAGSDTTVPPSEVAVRHRDRRALGLALTAVTVIGLCAYFLTEVAEPVNSQSEAAHKTVLISGSSAQDLGDNEIKITWKAERDAAYTVFTRSAGAAPHVDPVHSKTGTAIVYVKDGGGYCFKIWGTKLHGPQMESVAISIRGADCPLVFPPGDKFWLDD